MKDDHHLLDHLVLFGRYLRAVGIPVASRQLTTLAEGLTYVDIGNPEEFRDGAQAVLVTRHEHILPFGQAFARFWYRQEARQAQAPASPIHQLPSQRPRGPSLGPRTRPTPRHPRPDDREVARDRAGTFSAVEILRYKDFGRLNSAELAQIRRLLLATKWELPYRRTRRTLVDKRGRPPDMRTSWRRSLRYGGEVLSLSYRRRRLKPRPLVILCDVSGSMERYSRILLQFLYGLSNQGIRQVEAFAFGTRLTRLTRLLANRNVDQALDQAARAIHDWGGGTRIGEALKRFNYDWTRRVLRHGSIVLIISDGLDRGDVDLLAREMARLQRSCHRLIWLNPLLGGQGYQPLARGMQAALPFVDEFLPVHNLASLEQLARVLTASDR